MKIEQMIAEFRDERDKIDIAANAALDFINIKSGRSQDQEDRQLKVHPFFGAQLAYNGNNSRKGSTIMH